MNAHNIMISKMTQDLIRKLLATSIRKELIKESEQQPFEFIHSDNEIFSKGEVTGTETIDNEELDFSSI